MLFQAIIDGLVESACEVASIICLYHDGKPQTPVKEISSLNDKKLGEIFTGCSPAVSGLSVRSDEQVLPEWSALIRHLPNQGVSS